MTVLVVAGCFLALAALAGLGAAGVGSWRLAFPFVAGVPLLALLVAWQLAHTTGLPAHHGPPETAQYIAAVVQSPTPADRGAIYIWATPPTSVVPRGYRLPYSARLERQVAAATRAARRGLPVGIWTTRTSHGGHSGQGGRRQLRFYRLPPARPESKERR